MTWRTRNGHAVSFLYSFFFFSNLYTLPVILLVPLRWICQVFSIVNSRDCIKCTPWEMLLCWTVVNNSQYIVVLVNIRQKWSNIILWNSVFFFWKSCEAYLVDISIWEEGDVNVLFPNHWGLCYYVCRENYWHQYHWKYGALQEQLDFSEAYMMEMHFLYVEIEYG